MVYENASYADQNHTIIQVEIGGVVSFVPCIFGNSDFTRILELVGKGKLTIADYVPPPTTVTHVTMRQARLELLSRSLLNQVNSLIQQAEPAVQIEWEYATTVERGSALVAAIALQLNLTDQEIDEMFTSASKL
jgi:hypothetical protein